MARLGDRFRSNGALVFILGALVGLLCLGSSVQAQDRRKPDVVRLYDADGIYQGSGFPIGRYGPLISARHVVGPHLDDCAVYGPRQTPPPKMQATYVGGQFPVSCYRSAYSPEALASYTLTVEELQNASILDLVALDVDLSSLGKEGFLAPDVIVLPHDAVNNWKALGYLGVIPPRRELSEAPLSGCRQASKYAASLCSSGPDLDRGMSGGPLVSPDNAKLAGVNSYVIRKDTIYSGKDMEVALQRALESLRLWLGLNQESDIAGGGIAYVGIGFGPAMLDELFTAQPAYGSSYVAQFRTAVAAIRGTGGQCTNEGSKLLWGAEGDQRRAAPLSVYLLSGKSDLMADRDLARAFLYCVPKWTGGIGEGDLLGESTFQRVRSAACSRWPELVNEHSYFVAACHEEAKAAMDRLRKGLMDENSNLSGAEARAMLDTAGLLAAELLSTHGGNPSELLARKAAVDTVRVSYELMVLENSRLGTRFFDNEVRRGLAAVLDDPSGDNHPMFELAKKWVGTPSYVHMVHAAAEHERQRHGNEGANRVILQAGVALGERFGEQFKVYVRSDSPRFNISNDGVGHIIFDESSKQDWVKKHGTMAGSGKPDRLKNGAANVTFNEGSNYDKEELRADREGGGEKEPVP